MKVTKVSAEVQYSKAANDNAWKKINLGAEATITAEEDWREAQKSLYADLAAQLKELFTNGPQKAQRAPEEPPKPAGKHDNPGEPTDPSWCPIHNCKMKRHEKNGGIWHSHKVGNTWCRGKAK